MSQKFLRFSERRAAKLLIAIIGIGIALRLAGAWALRMPLQSDPLAYFTMAKELAEHGELLDQYGQHAFFSVGYPLVLAPFFYLAGSSVVVAIVVNVMLYAIAAWTIYRLALALSGNRTVGVVAAASLAVWLPGIWTAAHVAKENLSIPLLLGLALCAVAIARTERMAMPALAAGLLWGAALLTGGSALMTCGGAAVALLLAWRARASCGSALRGGLWFVVGAALMIAPWLYATNRMVGRPVLTTNAAFNLYIGNNPAANGRFVTMRDTPLGDGYPVTRVEFGEIGNADRLRDAALRWIAANPVRAAKLAALKLVYFWEPNFPDSADFAASRVVGAVRLFEVVQYCAILLLGLLAFRSRAVARDAKLIVAAMIAGFWLVHAAAYIIARYRDPAMPLLIAMAAVPVAGWLMNLADRRGASRAA